MDEKNTRESIFLAKLERILQTFDTLDELFEELNKFANEQPQNQQEADFLLSDYYHAIEDVDWSNDELLIICDKIKEARKKRRDENNTSALIGAHNVHKAKLQYAPKSTREQFRYKIKEIRKSLDTDYNYRILTEEDLHNLKQVKKERRQRRSNLPDKDEFIKCFEANMRNKDIAEKLNVDPSVVSRFRGIC